MLVVGQFYVAIPYVDAVAAKLAVSGTQAALIVSAFGFAYAPGMIVWGIASDKWGRANVISGGLAAAAALTASAATTSHFGLLLAVRALQGFFASSFSPTSVSLLAEHLPTRFRPLGMSVIGFAFLLSAPVVQYAAAASGAPLSTIFAVSAPLFLISAGAIRIIAGTAPAGGKGYAGSGSGLTPLLHDRVIVAAWCAAITVLFGYAAFQAAAQIVPALSEGPVPSSEHIRLHGMPALLVAFVAPLATLRHGSVTTSIGGLVVAAAAFAVAQLAFPRTLTLASIVVCAGTALSIPSLMGTVASRAHTSNRGLALGIYTCILFTGASIAPLAMHALAPAVWAMFSLPAASLAAAALLLWAARRSASTSKAEAHNPIRRDVRPGTGE